jgi:hypothetical protein
VSTQSIVNLSSTPYTVPGPIHGGIIFGITAALYGGEISLKDAVEQTSFNTSNSSASIRWPIH